MSDKQGWTAGPQVRGTFDILWTCLSTLALCVWTAVHPNILCTTSQRHAFVIRLGIMLVAIVFPKIIISAAWRQLKSSQMLRAKINSLCLKTLKEHHIERLGGGNIDKRRNRETTLPDLDFEDRSIITSRSQRVQQSEASMCDKGIIQLAELGLMPSISTSEIGERSKADIIAKMFVLAQITWFGMQVVGRLAGELPLTLLEIHTAVHIVCTIGIYLLLLKKPYDVHSSILLRDPDVKDMGALFSFSRVLNETHNLAYAQFQNTRVAYWNDRVVRAANNLLDHDLLPTLPVKEALTTAISRYSALPPEQLVSTSVPSKEQTLMNLAPHAHRALEMLRTHEGFTDQDVNLRIWDMLREKSENFAIREVWGGWSIDVGHEMSTEKGLHFLFNLLHGGSHLAAWASSSFPTAVEQWLWRGSAMILVLMPLWGCLWIGWWKAASSKWKVFYPVRNGDLDVPVAPFFFLVILAYASGRSFLLVESLVSLRGLPKGAFAVVNWSEYLPHIS
ncbi:hypothetical protein BKA65DRAFT_583594 [Rhexocercosporidium sp. MPI-PUGE-AT-0058]|nr:hypothetical protein BKA65DRAFT_583594 [Rhexocercosporidium sp. MPI-PUGE-AT-0058]